jgi:hypothetical protein
LQPVALGRPIQIAIAWNAAAIQARAPNNEKQQRPQQFVARAQRRKLKDGFRCIVIFSLLSSSLVRPRRVSDTKMEVVPATGD